MALKSDLVESAPKSPQGQILNHMSGSGVSKLRQASKSPGRPKDRSERGREKTKSENKGSNKSQERSKSGAHECWTCHEIVEGDHFGYNCPKGEGERDEKRPITPYPRKDRSQSGEKTKASQGNETYRRFRGYFGNPVPGPWRVISRGPAPADPEAAPAAVAAVPAQPDPTPAPGRGLMEEDRGGRECGKESQSSSITDMPWESPEESGEEDSNFIFLSNLASSLPIDSSEDEELETDPRYLISKRLMRALLGSADSGDSETGDTDKTQGQAKGGKAGVCTSYSSPGKKDRTDGTQLEDAREEEDLNGDPDDGPPVKDVEEDKRAKSEREQNGIDEVVQDMMKIELRQRRNEGDNEGYECGSKHQLMFNLWKVEKDWRSLTRREVQINPATNDTHNKRAV